MAFTCPRCGLTSHHPEDERHGYCGHCHRFTGPLDEGCARRGGICDCGSRPCALDHPPAGSS